MAAEEALDVFLGRQERIQLDHPFSLLGIVVVDDLDGSVSSLHLPLVSRQQLARDAPLLRARSFPLVFLDTAQLPLRSLQRGPHSSPQLRSPLIDLARFFNG